MQKLEKIMEELNVSVNKAYRNTKHDTKVTILAKKAAMICQFSIHNPLHVSFEDYNFSPKEKLEFERECNEKYRRENGELLYLLTLSFLDEMDNATEKERHDVFRLSRKKRGYLSDKCSRTITDNSSPENGGRCYTQFLGEDNHIYVKTDKGTVIRQF